MASVLAYPNLKLEFILETDTSCLGLGTILSKKQEDGCLHPVCYGSRALSPAEKNYGITDLETQAECFGKSAISDTIYATRM